ncbi:MAG TPA: outer membrane beta-barrel protein [Flavisolibacter sp.]|nr:outer membrane beta-barrel protein [Flavisolibacter sp.]
MRRIVITALAICAVHLVFAQDTTVTRTAPTRPANIGGYDHFMLQLGYTTWQGKPDSIHTGGLPRTFNVYFMFAFPFKTNPHLSVAIGPGIATDHIFFEDTYVGIKDNTPTLAFRDVGDTTHFKKYKLATAYLEAPVELRYSSNPDNDKRSFKVALGAKVGTLLSAWVKGKKLADKNDNDLASYTLKEKSKRFFNTNRLSVMGRIGYGKFSLFTSYTINPLFKEGVAPTVRPLTIGLTLSGL